jgi:hypothetical protein
MTIAIEPAAVPASRHLQAELRPYHRWLPMGHAAGGRRLRRLPGRDMGPGRHCRRWPCCSRSAGGAHCWRPIADWQLAGGGAALRAYRCAARLRQRWHAGAVAEAGAHDVVLVSYPMLQLNADSFAARGWNTLVLTRPRRQERRSQRTGWQRGRERRSSSRCRARPSRTGWPAVVDHAHLQSRPAR